MHFSAQAATEGSCGDPALPTPSLSHQTWSPRGAPQSPASATPLHALPFPGLPRGDDDDDDGKPAGHTEICRTSVLPSAAPGTFQLSHGENVETETHGGEISSVTHNADLSLASSPPKESAAAAL